MHNYRIHENHENKNIILLSLLFLYSLGIEQMEKYIVLLILATLILEVIIIKGGKFVIQMDRQIILLFFWCVLYSIMYIAAGNGILKGIVYYLVAPITLSLAGKRLVSHGTSEKQVVIQLLVIATGFFLHGTINILISIQKGYFLYSAENVYDIWSGGYISRTIIGMYLTPLMCISIPIISLGKSMFNAWLRILLAIAFVTTILLSVYIGNRTLLIIAVFLICIDVLIGLKVSKHKKAFVALLFLVGVAVILIYSSNYWGVREYVSNSYLARRKGDNLIKNVRWAVYGQVFLHFFDYILGWITSKNSSAFIGLNWAHNIWIDIFIFGGLFPAIIFIIYSIGIIRDMFRVFRYAIEPCMRLLAVTVVVGLFLNWAVEPILEADPYYFSICCGIFTMFRQVACQQLCKMKISLHKI